MSRTSLQQGANMTQRRLQSVWTVLQVLSAKNRTNPEPCKSLLPIRHLRRKSNSLHLKEQELFNPTSPYRDYLQMGVAEKMPAIVEPHAPRGCRLKPRCKEADSWWEKFSLGRRPCQFWRLPEEHLSCANRRTEGNVVVFL